MSAPDLSVAFGMPPEAALAYFRSKGYAIGWDWREVWQQAHAKAFTVAGVMKVDALQAIRGRLDQAIEKGETLEQWKRKLVPELEKLGLWGRHKLLNDETGEVKTLSPWRLQNTFRTNVQSAYMAGRYQEQVATAAARPWWQYLAVMDSSTRPSHAALHNRVFRWDDPIWRYIYPMNGFGCRCRVRARTDGELQRSGLAVSSSTGKLSTIMVQPWADRPPVEVTRFEYAPGKYFAPDPGFNYNPGEHWSRPFTPPPIDTLPQTFPVGVPLPALPLPAVVPASSVLPPGLLPQDYARAFLAEFGADLDRPVVFSDAVRTPLTIGADLFRSSDGSWKADRAGRGPFMRLLADAIRTPDEVWLRWEASRDQPGTWLLKRRYIKTFQIVGAQVQYGLSVFEWGRDGWSGSTVMVAQPDRSPEARQRYIERQRDGFLLFRRQK